MHVPTQLPGGYSLYIRIQIFPQCSHKVIMLSTANMSSIWLSKSTTSLWLWRTKRPHYQAYAGIQTWKQSTDTCTHGNFQCSKLTSSAKISKTLQKSCSEIGMLLTVFSQLLQVEQSEIERGKCADTLWLVHRKFSVFLWNMSGDRKRDQETSFLSSEAGNVPFLHCLLAVFLQPGCTEKR